MTPNGPGQSAQLLLAVVAELGKLDIPYAVIGALAASFHGVVRSSLDADALISVADRPGLASSLVSRLRECGLEVEHRGGSVGDPVDSVIVITDHFQNRVDLLTGIRGMSPLFLSRTITAPILGSTLEMIGAEDFVAMKVFAGGPRDLEDALGVLQVSADSLNFALLMELAEGYGREVADRLSELTQR